MNWKLIIPAILVSSMVAAPQSIQKAPPNGGDFSSDVPGPKVPSGVILVKGAWPSSSDATSPNPEGGTVTGNEYANDYFGMRYPLPEGWAELYEGPPPSESGRYVLAQIGPAETFKGSARGTILISAEDMFFTAQPAANALDLVKYSRNHLQADYKVEIPPTAAKVGDHPFVFFAYWSPAAQLHWYVLSTEIRCHAVEFILSSQDTKLLDRLLSDLNRIKLPADASPTSGTGGGAFPFCIKDYARDENLINRVEPVFGQHRYNPVPVRIIIDKAGNVKHIHFLSAFPDQAQAITDALRQWKFKAYLRDGKPSEVETGIMFGTPAFPTRRGPSSAVE